MHRRFLTLVLLGAALVICGSAVAGGHEGYAFLDRLDEARDAGALSADEALLYKFYYVFDQDKLPVDYRPDSFPPLKCATPLIQEFEQSRGSLQDATVASVETMLAPSGGDKATHISPSGIFRFTYSTFGGDAVPGTDVDPANGVPDFVEWCAGYMDYSWDFEITTMGFTAPPLSPYYEVDFESMGAYGYTQVVSGTRTRITLHNTFLGFPANDDPEGNQKGAAKVTCAHEFKHASQRAQSNWSEGGWVELDATWMEDIAYDVVNDYYNYIWSGCGITAPHLSLDDGGSGSYEDCIWQLWMSETYGNQIIIDFWDWRSTHTSQSVLNSYNSILGLNGSSLAEAYGLFGGWNFACGTRSIPAIGYGEAADYPNSLVTTHASYPYTESGTLDHLAAKLLYNGGFTAGEPGTLHISFEGDDATSMGLVAVIEKRDGTGVFEPIPLDFLMDAETDLSVPCADILSVGIAISNTASSGSDRPWSITLSKNLPDVVVDLSSSTLDAELDIDETTMLGLTITNVGAPGSILEYDVVEMTEMPAAKAAAPRALSVTRREENRVVPELKQGGTITPSRYAGDCILGNDDLGNVQGYYSTWWVGEEAYAYRINPADYTCTCDPGFNVRAMHMVLYLETTSTPGMVAHLMAASGTCTTPGAIIDSSDPVTVSGIGTNGLYDIEIPCDFVCADMDAEYFLVVEFTDTNGPVGIVIDNSPQSCVCYNEWGEGWKDVVDQYGFAGDIYIYADVDCCGVPDPEVTVIQPNGGEFVAVGSPLDMSWTATLLTDVKIELSRNNGSVWETVLASTPNDGAASATATGPVSTECLLRVSSLDDLYFDDSDAVFTIYEDIPWLSVDVDNGTLGQGESDVLTVTFDATGLAEGVYTGYVVFFSNAASSPDVVTATLTVTDTGSAVGDSPHVFALKGNYPNPFNPSTKVSFVIQEAGPATIDVLDLQGHVVRTLHSGHLDAGPADVVWDGTDAAGRQMASGTYVARLRAAGRRATHKMTLAK